MFGIWGFDQIIRVLEIVMREGREMRNVRFGDLGDEGGRNVGFDSRQGATKGANARTRRGGRV